LRNADEQPSTSLVSSDCGLDAYPELATSRDVRRLAPTICGSCGYQGSGGGNARESARLEDVLDVLAYAALRYAELAGDLPVGQTGCDKLSS